jgi:phospholipid/cholesterol/gamma-HCH transport system substrate-binding protein
MKTAKNAIAVGILTIVILSGLYIAIQFVSDSVGTSGQYRVWAVFPDASGLHEKSNVRIAGLKVGYIEKITLTTFTENVTDEKTGKVHPEERVGAKVVFLISGEAALHENAEALKAADSLLGDQVIVLHPGDMTTPTLKDGDQIKNVGEIGLMGNIDKISKDIQAVTANLKNVFGSDEGGKQMGEVLANLRDVSASINVLIKTNQETVSRTLSNIDGIAADARPGVRDIVNDLKNITEEIRTFVEKNADGAGEAMSEAGGTVKDIRKTVATLDKTIENLNQVIEGVNKGEGTVGRLLKDDKLIDDVENTVEDVGGLVSGITRLRTIVGMTTEYNVLSRGFRSSLQLRLQPREDKYYLIEAAYDPRGETTTTQTVVETTNPDDPPQYREVRHVTEDTLLFSLMFARRFYFATFRFGIKDNSGGLGLDIHFLRDRFELSTDIYKFGHDVFPRLKSMLAIEFLRQLYIVGGVTDALNDNRDFFFGLMIRFDDEDLKTILPFVPSTG